MPGTLSAARKRTKELDAESDAALALKIFYNPDTYEQGFCDYIKDRHLGYYWTAYCYRNRQGREVAFRTIYARRMIQHWSPEKMHRYTTMLDNQLLQAAARIPRHASMAAVAIGRDQ